MLRDCEFETERLTVRNWSSVSWPVEIRERLPEIVSAMISPKVAIGLPDEWRGTFTLARSHDWIVERDSEGVTLLIADKASGKPIGLILLFKEGRGDGVDIRLGYMLSEEWWGLGIATEAIEGVVRWCKGEPRIRTLLAGVALDNPASLRVLKKNGFRGTQSLDENQITLELRLDY